MLDLEKVVDQEQSTSDNSPSHKSESREPLRSDAQSSPIGEDTCSNTDEEKDASAENGGKGDVGAYFVSAVHQDCHCYHTDTLSESFDTRIGSTVFCTPFHSSEPSPPALLCR